MQLSAAALKFVQMHFEGKIFKQSSEKELLELIGFIDGYEEMGAKQREDLNIRMYKIKGGKFNKIGNYQSMKLLNSLNVMVNMIDKMKSSK